MPDYFDRYIRDDKHFNAAVEYILQNPVKAGLVDAPEKWPWSHGGRDARDPDRRYLVYRGATREGRKAAVIWRETEGWTADDYKRDKEFVAAQKLTEGMDDVYVNGDSYIPGARALEPLFKERMFAPVEV